MSLISIKSLNQKPVGIISNYSQFHKNLRMSEPLRQLSNTYLSNLSNYPEQKIEKSQLKTKQPSSKDMINISEIISINCSEINYGKCLPMTVYEKPLIITLKQSFEECVIVDLQIIVEDEELNKLDYYVFGIRKENSFEYYDEFKFKISQKGTYHFIAGIKTPPFINFSAKSVMKITAILNNEKPHTIGSINMSSIISVPLITNNKLLFSQNQEVKQIKIALIKNKNKKDIRILFKIDNNGIKMNKMILVPELIRNPFEQSWEEKIFEIKAKTIEVSLEKQNFLIPINVNYIPQLCKKLQEIKQKKQKCIINRKILSLKIKDTSVYYHFAIEFMIYPQLGKQSVNTQ